MVHQLWQMHHGVCPQLKKVRSLHGLRRVRGQTLIHHDITIQNKHTHTTGINRDIVRDWQTIVSIPSVPQRIFGFFRTFSDTSFHNHTLVIVTCSSGMVWFIQKFPRDQRWQWVPRTTFTVRVELHAMGSLGRWGSMAWRHGRNGGGLGFFWIIGHVVIYVRC